jgi:hypothetical protein
MPDDMTPDATDDATGDATNESEPGPELDATAPAGTPSVAAEATEPHGSVSTPDSGDADEATSAMPATPTAAHDEATSVLAATTEVGATGIMAGAVPTGDGGADTASDSDASAAPDGPRHAKKGLSRTLVISAVVAVVVLAGAGITLAVTSGTKPKKADARPPRPTAATMIPVTTTGALCPLTGEPAPNGQVPPRPALAFKVDNYPTARPQSGLEDADVVFEEPVEGGITRLVAIFQCQEANLVGPIRSARAIDVPILAQLNKPLFVHAGGINPVIALVNDANLYNDDVFTHASIVQHPSGRYAPYDTYASTAAAWALQPGDTAPPAPLYTYSTTVPTGTPVGSVHIPFSGTNNNTWTWSPINGAYLLSIGGVPANVADGGTRIGVQNLVVQTVHTTLGPWLENSEGGLEVQAQLTGSGPLAVFRNGVEITGTWQRASLTDTTSLVAADGSPIALAPGKTWVELVPSQIPVTTAPPVPGTP